MSRAELHAKSPLPYREFVALCACIMAGTALAIDIVLPAMLLIGEATGAGSANDAQWIITAYLIPFAFGQLLFGPLADRFGRKPIILVGLVLYSLASFLSLLDIDFDTLLLLRGLAGFGAASGRVAVVAIVRDCFAGKDMASVMSVVMMIFMVVPIVAPAGGQLLMELTSWHGIFGFMGLFGLVMIGWVGWRLPETLPEHARQSLRFSAIFKAFRIVLSNRLALAYALSMSVFFGGLFGFVNSAPQIYLELYDVGAWFPLAFSAGGGLVSIASLINSSVVQTLGMRRLSHGSLLMFIGLAAIMLIISVSFGGKPPVLLFAVGTASMFFFFGFIGTNFNALAMEPLGNNAGMASAIFGFLQMAIAGSVGAAIGQFYNGTTLPLLIGFLICGLSTVFLVLWGENGKLMGKE